MDDSRLRKTVKSMIRNVLLEQENKKSKTEPTPTPTPSPSPSPTKKSAEDKEGKKPKSKKPVIPGGEIRIATGAVGSGRFQKFVGEAGARAKSDPSGLMKDLGIKNAWGTDDLDKALSIVNAAIHTNYDMGEAYSGASISKEQNQKGDIIKTVGIYPGGINSRNGIKFISHTLQGAVNAGLLNITGGLEINRGRNTPIVIYIA
jgi:hypothetical protein